MSESTFHYLSLANLFCSAFRIIFLLPVHVLSFKSSSSFVLFLFTIQNECEKQRKHFPCISRQGFSCVRFFFCGNAIHNYYLMKSNQTCTICCSLVQKQVWFVWIITMKIRYTVITPFNDCNIIR